MIGEGWRGREGVRVLGVFDRWINMRSDVRKGEERDSDKWGRVKKVDGWHVPLDGQNRQVRFNCVGDIVSEKHP